MAIVESPLYPVGLVVAGQPVLVVGGGPVAARKAAGLVACGAVVTVVAPALSDAMRAVEGVTVECRPYRPGEAANYRLVMTATDEPDVTRTVYADADQAGVWINAADDPQHCTFTLPAILRRGPVTVSVATGGRSPALASWLRDRLDEVLDDEASVMADKLGSLRASVHAAARSTEDIDWRAVLDAAPPSDPGHRPSWWRRVLDAASGALAAGVPA